MTLPERVGIVGGGRMGAGIAHAFLLAGSDVTLVERDAASGDAARERIAESLRRSLERGATARTPADVASRLHVTADAEDLRGSELVVEAVFEDRDVKVAALRRAEAALGADAVLASNTSSIPIGDLAAALDRPARFLGLHFFNPVPSSALVEVVIGAETDPALADTARGWVAALGKAPVVVRDAPGFASSRLGLALALEAIRMVEDGVASAADIDTAMELGYRHATGPLRTTDIVGLDVRLGIAEQLHAALGERFAPPELLRRLVAEGHLGRKSGRGFYEWSTG
ncbi:3-hydroxyacyl-CoA dehydrogenase family protein [uncultured Microbacterium sp.]|uniref:Putative 3-hydroxybutyryl-CoA dehydrogenase n=1 Tax=uncultured Microbacterium sp. TaxID=191216 RepID=A0A1Y5P3D2_9MICO|nr:3-hydroxyacyl-CoA dehydrogenase family protein [uncultured Microbacterium sp.]SBS72030.1 putative 3-hydroxybutyryl-CoA dehydrogenase [uncultured Microbacterium sp.]